MDSGEVGGRMRESPMSTPAAPDLDALRDAAKHGVALGDLAEIAGVDSATMTRW